MVIIFISLNYKRAQFEIQQMAFMLVAVFVFFTLVGLFFLQLSLGDMRYSAQELERKQVISALLSWSELPELSCSDSSSGCIDEDKLYVLSSEDYNRLYGSFWPVASIKVYKINSNFSSGEIACPGLNCNYHDIYSSSQADGETIASYVSLCKKVKKDSAVFESCELATLSILMKKVGEE
jgi:hypothetical protein